MTPSPEAHDTPRRIPILMYHEVAEGDFGEFGKYVVRPEAFSRQMAMIARLGYRPVRMDHFVAYLTEGTALPGRAAVITFDDGFRGVADHAVPVLRKHGFPAIFYLVSDLVGARSVWLRALRGLELPLFDWAVAAALERAGFEIGSHSATHPRLSRLDDATSFVELERSRQTLMDRLGSSVEHVAYPHGAYDARIRRQAREAGYVSACSVRIGSSGRHDDLLALHRVPVDGTGTMLDFVAGLVTGRRPGDLAVSLRHRLKRLVAKMH